MGEHVSVRVDARDTIVTDSVGDAGHYPEFTFGLGVGFGGPRRPAPAPLPPADLDGDGLIDAADACPAEAGAPPSGCPVRDADSDGVADETDRCPAVSGIAPDGCPDPDPDKDGVLVEADRCPAVSGIAPDGCPDPDPDKDGVLAEADRCPDQVETANGFEDSDGCPDELPEKVKQFTGVIQGIEFDFGKTTIRKASLPTLDAAIQVLKEYPTLRIRITGHTDSVGAREINLERSAQRAAAVKDYLVQQGLDTSRIETAGAGPDSPIADNKTAAGRQKNRRIEFELLK
jgi:OOP family OmpA-OmpF porin